MRVLAVLGAGRMGRALGQAALKCGWRVVATRRHCDRLGELEKLGFEATCSNREAAERADVVLVAVKPWQVEEVAGEIRDVVRGKPVVSIAAGVPLARLRELLPGAEVYRAMPNLGAVYGLSATAVAGAGPSQKLVEEVLSCAGEVFWISEEKMAAWTGLAGSGPGILAALADAYLEACTASGLPRETCPRLVALVFEATGRLLREKHPSLLRDDVATPGGTTIEGIVVLERRGGRAALIDALLAAVDKAGRLG